MAKRKMAEMEKEMADQPKCDDDDPTSKSNRKWDRKGKSCTIQRINEEQGKGEEKEENLGRRCNCDINVSPEMESSKMEDQPKVQPFGKGVSDLICKIREIPVDNEANEVFLFELIRMATGALTKVRMESLVDEEIHGAQPELFIDIVPDFENHSLTIMDNGIGMMEDELVRRLCNIRGREKFKAIDAATHPDFDLSCYYSNVWGYRLGFHSVYMVAKRVEIDTETTGGLDRYKWVSEGCDSYTISRDDTTLGRRGTKVTLFLERNHWKYLDELVLTDLVKKYVRKFKYPICIVVDVDGVKKKREIVDEEKEKRRREGLPFEELKEKFEVLRQRFKEVLGSRVKDVVVRDGMDLADRLSRDMTTFEINPRSTIMEALRQKADAEDKDTTAHVEKKKKKKEKYLYTDGVYWGQETGEDLYREYLLGEEDEEEKEEKMNLKELILHRFRLSVSNIWLFDMRHGTSYLKQHPELGRP